MSPGDIWRYRSGFIIIITIIILKDTVVIISITVIIAINEYLYKIFLQSYHIYAKYMLVLLSKKSCKNTGNRNDNNNNNSNDNAVQIQMAKQNS